MEKIQPICTFCELKKLEVINICNGRNMGCVSDLELDLCLGRVTAIFVPKDFPLHDLFKKPRDRCHRIPWCDIERIGDDTILVKHVEEFL